MTHVREKLTLRPRRRHGLITGKLKLSRMVLDFRDVGIDRDSPASCDPALADLNPPISIPVLDLGCNRVSVPCQSFGNPGVDPSFRLEDKAFLRCASYHRFKGSSGLHGNVGSRVKELLVAAVAQDEAILGIVEGKALVDALDRINQPLPGISDLAQVLLFDFDCRVSEDGESSRHLPNLIPSIPG